MPDYAAATHPVLSQHLRQQRAANPRLTEELAYEAAPLGFVAEQAGGRASTGTERILDIVATSTTSGCRSSSAAPRRWAAPRLSTRRKARRLLRWQARSG
jgi:hypothetical protein